MQLQAAVEKEANRVAMRDIPDDFDGGSDDGLDNESEEPDMMTATPEERVLIMQLKTLKDETIKSHSRIREIWRSL